MWRGHRVATEHDFHKPKDLSRFPEHAQKYPSLERTHLCDVQRSTYNPAIPTLRQMDMDNALHKLPDQHCRTTTLCSAGAEIQISPDYKYAAVRTDGERVLIDCDRLWSADAFEISLWSPQCEL
ncbi:hypothetical protein AVEN_174127-1, partial [Araneus ventricosus]